MIVGLGIDLVEIERIARLWERFGFTFAKKILHANELSWLPPNPVNYLAARFAAKEAAVKALGTGFANGMWFQDFCVQKTSAGKPQLALYNSALNLFKKLECDQAHLSLTHSKLCAGAVVILEK